MADYEGSVDQVTPPEQRNTTRRMKTGGGQGRKSHACTECKRLKMRCEPLPGERRCSRCVRRGLECIYDRPYNSNLAVLPSSCENKLEQIGKDISAIQNTLDALTKQRSVLAFQTRQTSPIGSGSSKHGASPPNNGTDLNDDSDDDDLVRKPGAGPSHTAMTRESSPVGRPDVDQATLVRTVSMSDPMDSLYEVTKLRNLRVKQSDSPGSERSSEGPIDDFISRGVISEAQVEELYKLFMSSLNHYLWVGLEQIHDSFDSVRRSSTLLAATILTVTALHVPSSNQVFDTCYHQFLKHISASMFARKHNVDDVRGICIAAFWLSDVSWKLSGYGIRVATELGIHQSFPLALKGDREHFLRARLWYMLYVCDKHFSIAYGRPPMMSENLQIREYEKFLACGQADILDYRIISQVALFQVINRVYETLVKPTCHTESEASMVAEEQLRHMHGFNLEIDQWQQRWTARMEKNQFIGEFPVVGITLYSYFGKLLLNSLALRGVNAGSMHMSAERRGYANVAIDAAASIVSYVLEQPDLRRAMVGTPLYVHTMITWASVFLMKVATRWEHAEYNVDPTWVWNLIESMIQLLQNSMTSDRHVLHYIAEGLQKMLQKSKQATFATQAARQAQDSQSYAGTSSPTDMASIASSMPYSQSSQMNGLHHTLSSQMMDGMLQTSIPGHYSTCGPEMGFVPAPYNDTILNDSMIQEAFGGNVGYNVYDLLQNQFTHY